MSNTRKSVLIRKRAHRNKRDWRNLPGTVFAGADKPLKAVTTQLVAPNIPISANIQFIDLLNAIGTGPAIWQRTGNVIDLQYLELTYQINLSTRAHTTLNQTENMRIMVLWSNRYADAAGPSGDVPYYISNYDNQGTVSTTSQSQPNPIEDGNFEVLYDATAFSARNSVSATTRRLEAVTDYTVNPVNVHIVIPLHGRRSQYVFDINGGGVVHAPRWGALSLLYFGDHINSSTGAGLRYNARVVYKDA